MVCANLVEKGRLSDKIAEYTAHFFYVKVAGIDAYMARTFGEPLQSLRAASLLAVLVLAVIVLLVT